MISRASVTVYFMVERSSYPEKNENVVMVSEKEYNALQKAKRNAEYLAMLDQSIAEAEKSVEPKDRP